VARVMQINWSAWPVTERGSAGPDDRHQRVGKQSQSQTYRYDRPEASQELSHAILHATVRIAQCALCSMRPRAFIWWGCPYKIEIDPVAPCIASIQTGSVSWRRQRGVSPSRGDYFTGTGAPSNLYAPAATLRGAMNTGFLNYHEALLVRLAGLALIFGILWPGLWLLVTIAIRTLRHIVQHACRGMRELH
jgi:hypothetical protein